METKLVLRVLGTLLAGALVALILQPAGPAEAAGLSIVEADDARGLVTSIALDSSGNPVVSYENDNEDLGILHCNDPNCVGGESITAPDVADGRQVGSDSSLVLDALGYPVVSYRDGAPNNDLKVMHCNDPNCAGGDESITSPDTAGNVGGHTSLVLDSSGNPVVSYRDEGNGDLKLLHCDDPNCVAGGESITSPDTAGNVGRYTSLALDASGYPVVSYFDSTNDDLKVMHCNDANCAGGNESVTWPDTAGDVGQYTSLALDASGYPVVSYWDYTNKDLRVLHCGNADCTAGNSIVSPDGPGEVGAQTSLALDAAGNPVVSYEEDQPGVYRSDLKVLRCGDPACGAGNTVTAVDVASQVGVGPSLALDASGYPVISYLNLVGRALKVAHCASDACDADTDLDGCMDARELGPDETLGGLRSPKNPWDFYDTNGDRIVDLANDILGVVDRYAPQGQPPYDVAYDRGPQSGPDFWDMTAPDGVIDLANDILGVIRQYLHDCRP